LFNVHSSHALLNLVQLCKQSPPSGVSPVMVLVHLTQPLTLPLLFGLKLKLQVSLVACVATSAAAAVASEHSPLQTLEVTSQAVLQGRRHLRTDHDHPGSRRLRRDSDESGPSALVELVAERSMAFAESELPPKLHIVIPGDPVKNGAGLYELVKGENANGFPLWAKQGGGHWLYSGLGGRWLIGGPHEKELGFECDTGVIGTKLQHKGALPQKVSAGGWGLLDDGQGWQSSPHIVITTGEGVHHGIFGAASSSSSVAQASHKANRSKQYPILPMAWEKRSSACSAEQQGGLQGNGGKISTGTPEECMGYCARDPTCAGISYGLEEKECLYFTQVCSAGAWQPPTATCKDTYCNYDYVLPACPKTDLCSSSANASTPRGVCEYDAQHFWQCHNRKHIQSATGLDDSGNTIPATDCSNFGFASQADCNERCKSVLDCAAANHDQERESCGKRGYCQLIDGDTTKVKSWTQTGSVCVKGDEEAKPETCSEYCQRHYMTCVNGWEQGDSHCKKGPTQDGCSISRPNHICQCEPSGWHMLTKDSCGDEELGGADWDGKLKSGSVWQCMDSCRQDPRCKSMTWKSGNKCSYFRQPCKKGEEYDKPSVSCSKEACTYDVLPARYNSYQPKKCGGDVDGEYDCKVDANWTDITIVGWNPTDKSLDECKTFCDDSEDCVACAQSDQNKTWAVKKKLFSACASWEAKKGECGTLVMYFEKVNAVAKEAEQELAAQNPKNCINWLDRGANVPTSKDETKKIRQYVCAISKIGGPSSCRDLCDQDPGILAYSVDANDCKCYTESMLIYDDIFSKCDASKSTTWKDDEVAVIGWSGMTGAHGFECGGKKEAQDQASKKEAQTGLPTKDRPPPSLSSNMTGVVPVIDLGRANGVRFNLIRPRRWGDRMFYFLDANGDVLIQDKTDKDEVDWTSLDKLMALLPPQNRLLSETNNIIEVKGKFFSIPTLEDAKVAFKNPQAPLWPTGWYWTSSRNKKGYHESVFNSPELKEYHQYKDKQRLLVALELVDGANSGHGNQTVDCGGNEDFDASDFESKAKMVQAGWEFSWEKWAYHPPRFLVDFVGGKLAKDMYFGYKVDGTGEITLKLRNYGTFELHFGNSFNAGTVEVLLNGEIVATAEASTVGAVFKSSFNDGDTLMLRETEGVIVIEKIVFKCVPCKSEITNIKPTCVMTRADPVWKEQTSLDCGERVLGEDLKSYDSETAANVVDFIEISYPEPIAISMISIFQQDGCNEYGVYVAADKWSFEPVCYWNDLPNQKGSISRDDCNIQYSKPISYVRIMKSISKSCWTFDGYMHVVGVKVFGCSEPEGQHNLALGKIATASGVVATPADGEEPESSAVVTDGNEGTCFRSSQRNPSWVKVDLDKVVQVEMVKVSSPGAPKGATRLPPYGSGWTIRVGNKGDVSDAMCATNVDASNGDPVKVFCRAPQPIGRQLSIWSRMRIDMCEIMVYSQQKTDMPFYPGYVDSNCLCGKEGTRFKYEMMDPTPGNCERECTDWDNCIAFSYEEGSPYCYLYHKPGLSAGKLKTWISEQAPCAGGDGGSKCRKKTPSSTEYVRSDGICEHGMEEDAWADGSQLHVPYAPFPSAQACKDFCDIHAADCGGFSWSIDQKKCYWFRKHCNGDGRDGFLTYTRRAPDATFCTPTECDELCGCNCDCACTNCPCPKIHKCPFGGNRRCCVDKKNLALRAYAMASTEKDNGPASKAVDGDGGRGVWLDLPSGVCAFTHDHADSWIQIDLLKVHRINTIGIIGASVQQSQESSGWKILVGTTGGTKDEMCTDVVDAGGGEWRRFPCYEPKPIGHFVTVLSARHIMLCELEVYGEEVPVYSEAVNVGRVGAINFHLIKPYTKEGRVYYLLDQNNDGSGLPVDSDSLPLTALESFLPDAGDTLTDFNHQLFASGYHMKLPTIDIMPNLIFPANWPSGWYWSATKYDDDTAPKNKPACLIDHHFRAHTYNNPGPRCDEADTESHMMAVELSRTPQRPLKRWVLGDFEQSCIEVCGRQQATCDAPQMRRTLGLMKERQEASILRKGHVDDLQSEGMVPGTCKTLEGAGADGAALLPSFTSPSTCHVYQSTEDVVPDVCRAVPSGETVRMCACVGQALDPTRYSTTHMSESIDLVKRDLKDGVLLFSDREDIRLVSVPSEMAGGMLVAFPHGSMFDGVLKIAGPVSMRIYAFASARAHCGFINIPRHILMNIPLVMNQTDEEEQNFEIFEIDVLSKPGRLTSEFEITIETPCTGGLILQRLDNVACQDGTDDVNFVPGTVVGCDASWLEKPGLKEGETACAHGFRMCKSDEVAKTLGLTREKCEDEPGAGTFYASRQGNGPDDIWGCGKDGAGIEFVHKGGGGTFNLKIGDQDYGEWRQMKAHKDDEQLHVRKGPGNGGVMCCRAAKADNLPDWSRELQKTWTTNQCALMPTPYGSEANTDGDAIDKCKEACNDDKDCTAINYLSGAGAMEGATRCQMFSCNYPIARPNKAIEGWRGYYKKQDTWVCNAVGKESKYCAHNSVVGHCEYNVKEEISMSCEQFCDRYEMTCVDEFELAAPDKCQALSTIGRGCKHVDSRHMCKCSKPVLDLYPCVNTACKLTPFWCDAFEEAGVEEQYLCHITLSTSREPKGEWLLAWEDMRIGWSDEFDMNCNYRKVFCAGGTTYGHISQQVEAVKLALMNGGKHPRAPNKLQPCVYSQCSMIRVKQSGYLPLNGDYYPSNADCSSSLYGNTKGREAWHAYQSKQTEAYLTWNFRDLASKTRGWNLIYDNTPKYYYDGPIVDKKLTARRIPTDHWQVVPGQSASPIPQFMCINLTIKDLGGALAGMEDFIEPMVPGEELWADYQQRSVPDDLPLAYEHSLLIRLPWESKGTYSFRVPDIDVAVHVMLGCTRGPKTEDGEEEMKNDITGLARQELMMQGFEPAPESIAIIGDYCPGNPATKTKADVYRRVWTANSDITFALSQSYHVAVFVKLAKMENLHMGYLRQDAVFKCDAGYSLEKIASPNIFDGLVNVASFTEGGQSFASGALSGGCSKTDAGDYQGIGCGQGHHCFCRINDGLTGAHSAWIPGNATFKGNRFIGIRFPSLKALHGMRISSQAQPKGFWVRHVQSRCPTDTACNHNPGQRFYAPGGEFGSYALPTEPLYAEQWRDGALIWHGDIVLEDSISQMFPETACQRECELSGQRAHSPAEEQWLVNDVVFIPKLMGDPPGFRVFANKMKINQFSAPVEGERFFSNKHYFPDYQVTGKPSEAEVWRRGEMQWTGKITISPGKELMTPASACIKCDIHGFKSGGFRQAENFELGDVIHVPAFMKKDRHSEGDFTVQYTSVDHPTYDTPDDKWCNVGKIALPKQGFDVYSFEDNTGVPLKATAIRILTDNKLAMIDELVVYGAPVVPMVNAFGTEVVKGD